MAAASLGRLTLDLAVKLGSFEQGMTQAERKTKQTTDNMNKAFAGFKDQVADALGGTQLGSIVDSFNTKIGSLKGGVLVAGAALSGMAVGGIAAAIGGLTHLAIETAKADSQLLVLANRANTSVKSFQILEYASQGLGVSQDQLGSILADTQEKLGEFSATQGGGAADFFDALKNNTKLSEDQIKSFSKTLQGKDGIEAIQTLNDKLDELGVTSQERRFVFESLASDLGNLAPLFAENGRLLDDYGRALEDAGILKTEEAIKQSQLLAAQTQAVNLQFQGWKNQLVSGFMPAIVDVANAIFSTSKNGIQLQQVGEGIGSVLRSVTKVALGVSAAFSVAGKLIGGVAAAIAALKGEKINTINIMFDDIAATLDDYGTRINSLSESSSTTSTSSNNLVNAILAVNSASTKSATGLKINTKAADENAKASEKAANAAAKHAKELERVRQQQARERDQITKTYSTDFENINSTESEELSRILSAGFTSADQSKFTNLAKMRFDAERAEYFKSLSLELNEYKWSELKKLEYAYQQDREIAENSIKFNGVVKEAKLKFLDEQYAYQKKQLEISQAKELLQTKQLWLSASEYAEQYYALVREEILNTASYSPETKDAMIKQAIMQQGMEQNAEREGVWADYQYRFEPESQYQRDIDLLKDARDQMLITEEEYQRDRIALQAGYGAEYLNSLSGFFGSMLGKSSSAYQALFFAQKSFYLAQAGMNVWKSASDAYANEPGTVWQKMGAAALATLESGSFLSLIEAATPMGMAHDGIDNIPKEGTWLLDKGERVVDSRTNSDLKDYLAKGGGSGGDVYYTQTIHIASDGSATSESDAKQLGKMMENMTLAVIRREQRQGGLLAK